MDEANVTLQEDVPERARRQVIATAATDLERAARRVRELADVDWPVSQELVEEARSALQLLHEVLGSKRFTGPNGRGFGKAQPRRIYNGGDPSGLVQGIHWHHWGAEVSRGRGRTYILRPDGGYYRHLVRTKLRAHSLGHCRGSHRPAYRKLSFRVPTEPHGPLGPWQPWSRSRTICRF